MKKLLQIILCIIFIFTLLNINNKKYTNYRVFTDAGLDDEIALRLLFEYIIENDNSNIWISAVSGNTDVEDVYRNVLTIISEYINKLPANTKIYIDKYEADYDEYSTFFGIDGLNGRQNKDVVNPSNSTKENVFDDGEIIVISLSPCTLTAKYVKDNLNNRSDNVYVMAGRLNNEYEFNASFDIDAYNYLVDIGSTIIYADYLEEYESIMNDDKLRTNLFSSIVEVEPIITSLYHDYYDLMISINENTCCYDGVAMYLILNGE